MAKSLAQLVKEIASARESLEIMIRGQMDIRMREGAERRVNAAVAAYNRACASH